MLEQLQTPGNVHPQIVGTSLDHEHSVLSARCWSTCEVHIPAVIGR